MISLLLGLTLLQPPDSQAILRAARRAQAEFESFRRYHLPESSDFAGLPCDLNVGRYCFWYGDQTNWPAWVTPRRSCLETNGSRDNGYAI